MAVDLETGVTHIEDLDEDWPLATSADPLQAVRHEGDDHIRNIKTAIGGSLPVDIRNEAVWHSGQVLAVETGSAGKSLELIDTTRNSLTMLQQPTGQLFDASEGQFLLEWAAPGINLLQTLSCGNNTDLTIDKIGLWDSSNRSRLNLPNTNAIYFVLSNPGLGMSSPRPNPGWAEMQIEVYKNGSSDFTRSFMGVTTLSSLNQGYYPFAYTGWATGDYIELYFEFANHKDGFVPRVYLQQFELFAWVF